MAEASNEPAEVELSVKERTQKSLGSHPSIRSIQGLIINAMNSRKFSVARNRRCFGIRHHHTLPWWA